MMAPTPANSVFPNQTTIVRTTQIQNDFDGKIPPQNESLTSVSHTRFIS